MSTKMKTTKMKTTNMKLNDLATKLFEEYKLDGWRFHIGKMPKRLRDCAGICNNGYKFIQLSQFCVDNSDFDSSVDTLRHELAHAITNTMGHGKEWIEAAKVTGAKYENIGRVIYVGNKRQRFMNENEWLELLILNKKRK